MSQTEQKRDGKEIRLLLVPESLFELEDGKQTFLARRIFKIDRAGNFEEALSKARKNKPHLIIFSNEIKDLPVDKFCRSVRADLSPEIRLLMLTDMLTESADSPEEEADAHLVNPVDDRQLFKTVAGLLNLKVRGYSRVATDFITQVELFPKNGEKDVRFIANVVNISESGMRVESPLELPVGSMGRLHFFLPDEEESLVLYGLIKVLADEVSLHYGLEFVGNSPREKQLLRQYVQKAVEDGDVV